MVAGIGGVVLIFFLIFKGIVPGLQKKPDNTNKKIEGTLTIWGVLEDGGALKPAFEAFETLYPNIDVSYRGFADEARYETELLEALAVRQGPDIFMIRNRGLQRNKAKIAFAPAGRISLLSLRHLFPRVVEDDFTDRGQIGALPAYLDTLVLMYNRNLLNQAGIVYPPKTWEELEGMAGKVRVALGGSPDIIARAADIVELRALQEAAKEGKIIEGSATGGAAGARALEFYKKFKYEDLPYSPDAFGAGRVAMILGYSGDIKSIKARTSFVEPVIARVPQIQGSENPVALADYWGYAVSNQSPVQDIAWQFIVMLATNEGIAAGYANATGRPPALNSLIASRINDPAANATAEQALIARSIKTPDERRQREEVEQAIRNAVEVKN